MQIPPQVRRIFFGLYIDVPGGFSAICPLGRMLLNDDTHSYLGLDLYRFEASAGFEKVADVTENLLNVPLIVGRRPVIVICSQVGTDMILSIFRRRHLRPVEIVQITGGIAEGRPQENIHHIPKLELVSAFYQIVEQKRLSMDIKDSETKAEYENQVRSLTTSMQRRSQEPKEDEEQQVAEDLILSVATSCWFSEIKQPWGDRPRPSEVQEQNDPWKTSR